MHRMSPNSLLCVRKEMASHVTVTLSLYVLICVIVSLHYYYEYTFVKPTVGICNSTSVPPTTTTAPTIIPRELIQTWNENYVYQLCCEGVGLKISTSRVTNTSIGLQWTDDTPGIIEFKVCVCLHSTIVNCIN